MAQKLATSRPARKQPGDRFDFQRKPLYTPREVAQILQVSSQTVLDRIHDGSLFAVQVSERIYRVPLAALMQFLGVAAEIRHVRRPHAVIDDEAEERRLAAEHRRARK